MELIQIKANGTTSPKIEDGSLVLLVQDGVYTLGIFVYSKYTEIWNLTQIKYDLDLMDGVYLVESKALKKLSIANPHLVLNKATKKVEGEITILLEDEMILIGVREEKKGTPCFVPIKETGVLYESIYTFIEAFFPGDLKEERQFLYKCPEFYLGYLEG